jgi:hypothetical protein
VDIGKIIPAGEDLALIIILGGDIGAWRSWVREGLEASLGENSHHLERM